MYLTVYKLLTVARKRRNRKNKEQHTIEVLSNVVSTRYPVLLVFGNMF